MGKYQIRRTSSGQFRWTLKATNGENLITSEEYTTKQNCLNGISSSKINVADQSFQRKTSISGQPYFNQIAGNGSVLGTSEMYSNVYNRDAGIESTKRNAPTAIIEDLS